MPAFFAMVKTPNVKYVVERDAKTKEITGADPVARIQLESGDGDPHNLCTQIAELVGKRVKVQITLEQMEL